MSPKAGRRGKPPVDEILDRELGDLPPDLRRREWMGRIEAVLFASATPMPAAELARVIGEEVPVGELIEDIQAELADRPYELAELAGGWMFRTRPRFADAVRALVGPAMQPPDLSKTEMAVLCAVAYHQPIDRAGLRDIFGREIGRDLLGRLRDADLIATGPRAPRPGAPYTFVTTEEFLVTFDLQSLRDLPELEAGG